MNWISVNDQLPEEYEELIIKPDNDLTPIMSKKVIVLTDLGHVSDNKRLKMMVGEKEWTWFMGYSDGDVVTHWAIFEPPIDNTAH